MKSCTLEPGGLFTTKDFEEGVQTLDTAITEMSACSLKEEIKNEFPVNDKAEEKRVENNFSIFEYVKFSDCEVKGLVNELK